MPKLIIMIPYLGKGTSPLYELIFMIIWTLVKLGELRLLLLLVVLLFGII